MWYDRPRPGLHSEHTSWASFGQSRQPKEPRLLPGPTAATSPGGLENVMCTCHRRFPHGRWSPFSLFGVLLIGRKSRESLRGKACTSCFPTGVRAPHGHTAPRHSMSLSTGPACELRTPGGLLPLLESRVPPLYLGWQSCPQHKAC